MAVARGVQGIVLVVEGRGLAPPAIVPALSAIPALETVFPAVLAMKSMDWSVVLVEMVLSRMGQLTARLVMPVV